MVSLKLASIVAIAAFAGGSLFAPPIQQAIAAVIATDVQCTGCVGSSDVAGSAITAAKIKDGEVKAAEIATDAVGAAELQGVTKLLYGQCVASTDEGNTLVGSGTLLVINCSVKGVDQSDSAIASQNSDNQCFKVSTVQPTTNTVVVALVNDCSFGSTFGAGEKLSVIVYDK
jgi:hypothetical protein